MRANLWHVKDEGAIRTNVASQVEEVMMRA